MYGLPAWKMHLSFRSAHVQMWFVASHKTLYFRRTFSTRRNGPVLNSSFPQTPESVNNNRFAPRSIVDLLLPNVVGDWAEDFDPWGMSHWVWDLVPQCFPLKPTHPMHGCGFEISKAQFYLFVHMTSFVFQENRMLQLFFCCFALACRSQLEPIRSDLSLNSSSEMYKLKWFDRRTPDKKTSVTSLHSAHCCVDKFWPLWKRNLELSCRKPQEQMTMQKQNWPLQIWLGCAGGI